MCEEWIKFYDAHLSRVIRFVMHGGASQDEARDATHDAFTESWILMVEDPSRWQAIERKEAWIRQVALRRYRRPPGSRKRPLVQGGCEIPELADSGPGHDELTAQAHMVLQALKTLDSEACTVMAFDLDGIPTSHIAAELEITPQRVRDIRKKARAALKRHLTENENDGGGQP